jgi:hypothetical protein
MLLAFSVQFFCFQKPKDCLTNEAENIYGLFREIKLYLNSQEQASETLVDFFSDVPREACLLLHRVCNRSVQVERKEQVREVPYCLKSIPNIKEIFDGNVSL